MSEKVLEDISNEQAGAEGPRRSRRSLNRKGAEGASKDERASLDRNNNAGQVDIEDTLFKEVSIPGKGFLGWTRGRARGSGRGLPSKRGGNSSREQQALLDSQRSLKRQAANERKRLFRANQKNIASAQTPKKDNWILTCSLLAARGNLQAQEILQRGTQSPVVNGGELGARGGAGAATEQQDAGMQFDAALKPEFGKQDNDVEVTWESHPRTPENLEMMQEWRKLESLKAKKRKFVMEVENAEAEIEAQRLVLRARFEEAVL